LLVSGLFWSCGVSSVVDGSNWETVGCEDGVGVWEDPRFESYTECCVLVVQGDPCDILYSAELELPYR